MLQNPTIKEAANAENAMNATKVLALVLIVAGLIALAYQGFTYKTRESVVDLGPLHVTAEKTHSVPLPPILGAVAFVGGIGILFMSRNR